MPTVVYGSRLSRAVQSMNLWIGVGTFGSIGLALVGTSLGAIPRPADDPWWFHVSAGGSTPAHLAFYLSVVLLIAGWIGVGYHARGGRLTVSRGWVVLALWGLPLLVGPPLFSRDIYSYIGQGLLAHHGLNPYSVPPAALGNGPLLASIASVWRHTASPYGPLFVTVSRAAASISGGSVVAQVHGVPGHGADRCGVDHGLAAHPWLVDWAPILGWPCGSAPSARWPCSASSPRATMTP